MSITGYEAFVCVWSRGGGGGGGGGNLFVQIVQCPSVGQMWDLLFKFANTTLFIQVINVKMNSSPCVSAKRCASSRIKHVQPFIWLP